MFLLCRIRSLTLGLAASSAPLLLALALHGQPAPQSAKPFVGKPQQVADALDKIVQPRFQDVTAGQFGMTRLIPAVRGHESVGFLGAFPTNTSAETSLLASANAMHRPYVMAFLHCAHVPGQSSRILPPGGMNVASATLGSDILPRFSTIVVSRIPSNLPVSYSEKTEAALHKSALRVLPTALQGRSVQTQSGNWTLFLRPVSVSKASCLTCHTGAKRGDTLGVMVYAVSNTVNKN